jgi:hypothetical protein
MLYFRSCPHCTTGTVLLDRDQVGAYFECVNCGWMLDLRRTESGGVHQTGLEAPVTAEPAVASLPAA